MPIPSDIDELNKLRRTNRVLIAMDIALCAIVPVPLIFFGNHYTVEEARARSEGV